MADELKRLTVLIDADLHREVKVIAAQKGETIGAFVTAAIKEKLKKENKE